MGQIRNMGQTPRTIRLRRASAPDPVFTEPSNPFGNMTPPAVNRRNRRRQASNYNRIWMSKGYANCRLRPPPKSRFHGCSPMNCFPQRRRPLRTVTGLVVALTLLALAGCTSMPLKEGPRARLFKGVQKPRSRHSMDITVHEIPITAWAKCIELLAPVNPALAVFSIVTLSPIHGCARLPPDSKLARGQRAWCIIAVPEGDTETLEHELRHCEGWDHPHEHDPSDVADIDSDSQVDDL